MKVFERIAEVTGWRGELTRDAEPIGFVPTMGALHEGHLSLIRAAREDCRRVIVSVFVNPTQFGPGEDLTTYPRDRDGDLAAVESLGVDAVWFGSSSELYPPDFATEVTLPSLAAGLCGRGRPHHFGGVALIVLKLLNVVRPHRAYFGRKDYQQLRIVERMVADLDLPVEVVPGDTVREKSGLAMSSRNLKLSDAGREAAAALNEGLVRAREACAAGETRAARLVAAALVPIVARAEIRLEYLDVVSAETLEELTEVTAPAIIAVAASVEGVRLIDNMALNPAS